MDNPWTQLRSEPPFCLASDCTMLQDYNSAATKDHRLHLELLPDPFIGSKHAPIVLLQLNPGFDPKDRLHHNDPVFARLCRGNLQHRASDFPFYYLSPETTCPGRYYWESKLRQPIQLAGRNKVSNSFFCVEYFPYHSRKFAHERLVVPSRDYGFQLVRDSVQRNALVIVMRGKRPWVTQVPELEGYRRLAEVRNPRNPTISQGNLPRFFDDIKRILGRY